MVKKLVKVKFKGIDSWCRPIFKAVNSNDYYGSTWNLYGYDQIEKLLEDYSDENLLNDLVYFGSSFDCEPMGLPLDNIRLELV